MEREGPQTNEGKGLTPPEANVVQLGDWIGPRDELVPFGRQPRPRLPQRPPEQEPGVRLDAGAASAPEEGPAPAAVPPEPPPSAEDFWGERAAAIHDALQAPSDKPVGAGNEVPADIGRDAAAQARVRGRYRRFGRRARVAAASLAILALAGLATALNPLGGGASQHGATAGSRLPLASVLNGGVARALTLGLARLEPSTTRAYAPAAGRVRVRRHVSRAHPTSDLVRDTTSARSTSAVSPHSPTTAYAARVVPATAAPTHAADSPSESAPPPTSSETEPTSSSAAAPATGASGALGPIQSPNG